MEYRRLARRGAVWGAALAVSSVLPSCIGGQQTAVALYDGDPAPSSEVARLSGYVRYVDGVDVATRGSVFELLPGCHLVGTPDSWGRSEASYGAAVVNTGRLDFALVMRPAHHYAIEVDTDHATGPTGRAWVMAVERDPSGKITKTFGPVQNEEDAERCLAAAPR